jgi:hypothetical protein
VIRKIDPKNKVRFEKNVVKKRVEIKKAIDKAIDEAGEG